MAGSVGQGQRRGLEGVERSEGRSGFLAGDRCRRRNIWLAEFRLARSSGSPGSGWGDADWEKLWGTNDFPRRVSLGSGFPVALLSGDDAEVSSSERTQGARIVHHDLLLSSGGFFAREVRVPKTSSESGGRSDADTADTAEVAPEKEVLVRKTRASLDRQTRQSGSPPVLDVTGLTGVEVRAEQRLLLTDSHLSATDADTLLAGVVDPAKITFRISAITGGKLQSLSSSGAWEDMGLATGETYYAFTLADLRAGNVAFLAGDGLQAGGGEQITFKVQAADDGPHLSDSDDATPGAQAADGTIAVDRAAAAMTAGVGGRINRDGVLTPGSTALGVWQASATTHGGTLHLVVKLQDKESGDALSLRGNYDTSKITPQWDAESGELSLEVSSGATAAEIGTALERLWLDTALSASDGTRQVWVFPTLSGVAGLVYRVDETTGLVRYYFYDSRSQSFADATTAAAGRRLFGKSGYLGVPTSDAEKSVYKLLRKSGDVHLAISDSRTEGKWLVTAGPRKGQIFWDNTNDRFGPGAAGSGWNAQTDFWWSGHPSNGGPDQARMSGGPYIFNLSDGSGKSVGYHDLWLADGEVFMRPVDVGESPPRPFLEVDVGRLRVDSGQLVVLTADHILVIDVDTLDVHDNLDASKITLRVSGVSGGTLQSLDSTSGSWKNIDLTPSTQYREFTLADLKAGKVAFLAGDGVASADGGEGKKITFKVQAVDNDGNFSDSDPSTSDPDPVDVEILILPSAEVIAGSPGLLNADGVLTPDGATLTSWKQDATTHGGALHVIVKLSGRQAADDALSLATGYDASKVTPGGWNAATGELSIVFADNTTISEMKTALELLELTPEASLSSSTRKVWIFPTLSGVSKYRYRVDEAAGLVRHYLYDSTGRSFADATTAASERILFGKHGYLGVFTSDAERDIYNALVPSSHYLYLGLTDTETEGKWVITAGPRKGQLFWDNTNNQFGLGAAGSGWNAPTDFWSSTPDGGARQNYARMGQGILSDYSHRTDRKSISHHDLQLQAGDIFSRPVDVRESSLAPVLEVDLGEVRRTAQRHLILTEDHISVDDPDTRDPLDDNKVDASKIELRIMNIPDDTLYARISMSAPWVAMTKVISQDYYAFTLAQLQGGLVSLLPNAAGTLTFKVQAADAGMPNDPTSSPHLSDSDRSTSDPDPESVSVSVVALRKVAAGEEVRINGDGALTPDDDTLDAWLTANDALQIFVVLQEGKSGIFTPSAGVVHEHLSVASSHGVASSKIVVSWDPDTWRLSLAAVSGGNATRADFQAILNALQLQTVHFGQVSHRTISVSPELSGDVFKKEFHVREVEVSASAPNPLMEVAFDGLRVDSGQRLVLTEEDIFVYDPDTTDASSVWLRVTGLTGGELPGGELQRRSTSSATDWTKIVAGGKAYLAFTLAELRAGRIALLAGDGLASGDGTKVVFRVQAADATDAPGNAANLSATPLDVEIPVVSSAKAISGAPVRVLINADGALTPGETTFNSWKARVATGSLHLRVGLVGKQKGDVLSLRSGYDASKITPEWKEKIGELWLDIGAGTTVAEMQAALALLEFESALSDSASTRNVWLFPTITGRSDVAYRFDPAAGLVRYYYYDNTARSFSDASEKARERTADGRGYLGVPTSNAEKTIYRGLITQDIHLAISDDGSEDTTEGMWVVTDGPRKGQLFWNHVANPKVYGRGADGSGWDAQGDFWHTARWSSDPDGGDTENYARMDSGGRVYDSAEGNRGSVIHEDFVLFGRGILGRGIFARVLEVAESPPNPVLRVDFDGSRATAQRPLVLSEDQIWVKDVDTVLGDGSVDASRIKFRITNVSDGTLRSRPSDASDVWTKIPPSGTAGNQYWEFTLTQLQGSLVALFPDAAGTFTFKVQAADDGDGTPGSPPHLSDSDPYDGESDADPTSVSVSVVGLKTVASGAKVSLNDDVALTPHDDTLDAWLAADDTLQIFVVLRGGKSGIFTPSAGVVQEHLSVDSSHGVGSDRIVVSWDADKWRLSLAGTGSATRVDFQKVLGTLQLQTVPFGQVSHRTILVQPDMSDMSVPIARAGYYLREVEVGVSLPNPILEVAFEKTRLDSGQRLVLTQEHILVYDPDTHDGDGNVDPSRIWFRITGLTGGELQSRPASDSDVWTKIPLRGPGGSQYREFTLADLRAGKIAFLAGDGVSKADGGEGKKIVFQVQAADAPDNNANLSDSDPNDGEGDADPVDVQVLIVSSTAVIAGESSLINADEVLTPDPATLNAWKQEAEGAPHRGTLHVVVRLLDKQTGDVLSLRTGYDTSKITPQWDGSKGELSLEIGGGTTATNIQEALALLELDTEVAGSASTRKVWVFPVLSGVGNFGYRVDETAGLVRYYLHDGTGRSFSAASTAASGRILFGKQGYLGVPLSNAGKSIYAGLRKGGYVRLALTDTATEGKWVITAGPRSGELFWDHGAKTFGPGAQGSGWTSKGHFWDSGEPDGGNSEDYARMGYGERISDYSDRNYYHSISHHDLLSSDGFVRLVEVRKSPLSPVLTVDFSKFQATARRPLILTEDQISVDDLDTRDSVDPTKLDASKIKFRITNIRNGTLQSRLASDPDTWIEDFPQRHSRKSVPGVHSCPVAEWSGCLFPRRCYISACLRYPGCG